MTTSQPAEPVGAVEGLLRAAGGLTANQLAILSGVADALSRPVEITRPTGSDLVDDTFAETMANLLTLHHALHEEPLSKRPFEYVFKQCLRAQGIGAELNLQPGDSSYDIDADGVRWSLKTEAAKGISPSQVKVEKFMEARWIRECTTPEACATAVPKIISHMDGYDRIIVLRAFERSPYVHYRLEEIPKALLERCLAGATASMFEKRGRALSYGADFYTDDVVTRGRAFRLLLDSSVEKIRLWYDVDHCRRHGQWTVQVHDSGALQRYLNGSWA